MYECADEIFAKAKFTGKLSHRLIS